jgi:hypothetical protein
MIKNFLCSWQRVTLVRDSQVEVHWPSAGSKPFDAELLYRSRVLPLKHDLNNGQFTRRAITKNNGHPALIQIVVPIYHVPLWLFPVIEKEEPYKRKGV